MNRFKVYALILNYNSAPDTIKLYRQLLNLSVEILVMDNDSIKADIEILEKSISSKHLVKNNKNLGYGAGNNIGIKKALDAGADYVWILNPDIQIHKDTLAIFIETMKNDLKLAAVGPRILRFENKEVIFSDGGTLVYDERCHADHTNYGQLVEKNPAYINYNVDYIDGSCIFIRRKALLELGLLPEKYFLYFEETHWCVNAKRNGWKLAAILSAVVYNKESPRNITYTFYTFRNRLLFAHRFHPQPNLVFKYYRNLLLQQFLKRVFKREKSLFLKARIKALIEAERLKL